MRPVIVRIPGADIDAFRTHWYAKDNSCSHRAVERGGLVRTRTSVTYWNRDFPALKVASVLYPKQTVYVRHQIDIY